MTTVEANEQVVINPLVKRFLWPRRGVVFSYAPCFEFAERYGAVRVMELWFCRDEERRCRVAGFCLN